MRVITRKRLIEFAQRHPGTRAGLAHWYRVMKHTNFSSLADVKRALPGTDPVGSLTVFNVGGNKARLIAAIHYNRKIVYVRHVLTHADYDKEKWKE